MIKSKANASSNKAKNNLILKRNYFLILGVDESTLDIEVALTDLATVKANVETAYNNSLEFINSDKQKLTNKQKQDLTALLEIAYTELQTEEQIKTYLEKQYPIDKENTKDRSRFDYINALSFSKAGTRLLAVYKDHEPKLAPQNPKPSHAETTTAHAPVFPTEQAKPNKPAKPVKPAIIMVPVEYEEPTKPAESTNTVDLTKTEESTKSVEPSNPAESIQPPAKPPKPAALTPTQTNTATDTVTISAEPVKATPEKAVQHNTPVAPKTKLDIFIETVLNKYAAERNTKEEYIKRFFCINFGYSKTKKLNAVNNLIIALKSEDKNWPLDFDVLSNGNLGKQINKFLKENNDLFADTKISNLEDLVHHLTTTQQAKKIN